MTAPIITVTKASPDCLPEILEILTAADLPHEGVSEHIGGFLIARSGGGSVIGCVGLERYGALGLLRSAAVLPEHRGQGVGSKLIRHLLESAAQDGVQEVALLTTTAKDYFEKKFGFKEARRSRYEKRLAVSPEWNLPRCSSAVFMVLHLAATARQGHSL
jgi:N-acetylglutamate synthase-like GNAT family acetyltransferase